MFRNTVIRNANLILATLTFAFLSVVQIAFASTANADAACADAITADLNTTHRGYEDGRFKNGIESLQLVRMEVESTGILALDLAASNPAVVEARLSLFQCRDGLDSEDDAMVIERAVDRLAIAVKRPGLLYFRLGAQDPSHQLKEYKLTNRFVAATLDEDELVPDPKLAELADLGGVTVVRSHFFAIDFLEKVGEDPTDPGEDGLWRAPSDPGHLLLSVASVHTLASTASKKVGEDPTDPGEDGLVAGSSTGSDSWALTQELRDESALPETSMNMLQRLFWPDGQEHLSYARPVGVSEVGFRTDRFCLRDEHDDHGDTLRCSTPIVPSHMVRGEIANDWSDDHDTFSFTLSELATVRIEMAGDFEAGVVVYGRSGQRIQHQTGSLATTLAPGDYFIRIFAGENAGGAYLLELEVLEW